MNAMLPAWHVNCIFEGHSPAPPEDVIGDLQEVLHDNLIGTISNSGPGVYSAVLYVRAESKEAAERRATTLIVVQCDKANLVSPVVRRAKATLAPKSA